MLYSVQAQYLISIYSQDVVHDRRNISQIFTYLFNFNVQCHTVPLIYLTVFEDDSIWGSMVRRWVGMGVGS